MDAQCERRHVPDRRDCTVFYRYGYERRDSTGNRRLDLAEDDQPNANRGGISGNNGTSGNAVEVTKEIADAFGLPPALLEAVENDELQINSEPCQFCADRDIKYAEIEAELARSRKESERYRNQVRELLLSLDISRH